MATKICYNQLSTIMKLQNIQQAQSLQTVLMNQINMLYKNIDILKAQNCSQRQLNQQLANDNKKIMQKFQLIQKQKNMFKSMYQLQRQNHERLRKFYQQRQIEWIQIIEQQKRIIEQYDISQAQNILQTQKSIGILSISSKKKNFSPRKNTHINAYNKDKNQSQQALNEINKQQKIESKKVKKLSLRNCISQPKYIYIDERQNKQDMIDSKKVMVSKKQDKKLQVKNLQNDDILDLILRKIYYQNRQKSISVDQISKLQDMIKLKKAKTSTRQRLIKTLKKLFNHQNQKQILIFCDYVERQIINQHKMLLGELVYNFLIQKLKECQRLALSSNSILSNLDKNNSIIGQKSTQKIYIKNDKQIKTNKVDLYNNTQSDSFLHLNSINKIQRVQSIEKQQIFDEKDENIRYSISSLRNLSELINEDTGYLLNQTNLMSNKLIKMNISIQ